MTNEKGHKINGLKEVELSRHMLSTSSLNLILPELAITPIRSEDEGMNVIAYINLYGRQNPAIPKKQKEITHPTGHRHSQGMVQSHLRIK